MDLLAHSKYKDSLARLNSEYDAAQVRKIKERDWLSAHSAQSGLPEYDRSTARLQTAEAQNVIYRATIKRWLSDKKVGGDNNDTNYIFLRFVTDYLPEGIGRIADRSHFHWRRTGDPFAARAPIHSSLPVPSSIFIKDFSTKKLFQ